MKEVILCKYGELILKGANRSRFESQLIRELRRRAAHIGNFQIRWAQSTVYIEPQTDTEDVAQMYQQVKKVFGFASVTRAVACEKTMDAIFAAARAYLPEKLRGYKTFRCEAKRSDKMFPLKSPAIAAEVGGVILEAMPDLSVDLTHPEITVRVEIRDKMAYIHAGQEACCFYPAGSTVRWPGI